MLSQKFLEPYRAKGDVFPNLLARSTYLSKYSRNGESWTETCRRVVEANCNGLTDRLEAELLFHVFYTMQALPPGRGLYSGGVTGMPVTARFNCSATQLRSTDDLRWAAYMLMSGSGVGISLARIDELPSVSSSPARLWIVCSRSHPDRGDVDPDELVLGDPFEVVVDDSREGWAKAFRDVLDAAFAGQDILINVSSLRPYGAPLRTFGGNASGPGALVNLLRNAWAIIRKRAGGRLTSVDCLDLVNWTGVAIRAGGARRSALIVLGDASDMAFRQAKHDAAAIESHRGTSNNSIMLVDPYQIEDFDWNGLVKNMMQYGEPGIINMHKIWQTDPDATTVNPCSEIPLENREVCCLSEIYPSRFQLDPSTVLRLFTRYTLRQRVGVHFNDAEMDEVHARNMRIGVSLCGITDFDCTDEKMQEWYKVTREEADSYADELGVSRPNCVTTVKPDGTVGLLGGSSPGIHSSYAPYYIRRTRISEVEPMAQALIEAGVPYEMDVYDKTGRTLVFEFPMMSVASAYSTTETVSDQIERLVRVQRNWCDNAVSMTVNFHEHEAEELAVLLAENIHDIKSVSCLPHAHSYKQPPYEAITREEYNNRARVINSSHPLTTTGEGIEISECKSLGYCPT